MIDAQEGKGVGARGQAALDVRKRGTSIHAVWTVGGECRLALGRQAWIETTAAWQQPLGRADMWDDSAHALGRFDLLQLGRAGSTR